jgi:hypothetical protein
MKYTNEDFVRLISAVEEQGGDLLDETCAKDEIAYEMPDGKTKVLHTHGCEAEYLFEVPYDPTETVLVPEILTEDDPKRGTYVGPDGTERHVQRSKYDEDKNPIFEIVEREGGPDAGGEVYATPVKVCAVADNVGAWPRFRHAIKDKESG